MINGSRKEHGKKDINGKNRKQAKEHCFFKNGEQGLADKELVPEKYRDKEKSKYKDGSRS